MIGEALSPPKRNAILVSLFKNGSKNICDNFHELSLFVNFIRKILKYVALNVLTASQCRFRPNCSTTNMIFTARQIQKCREQ